MATQVYFEDVKAGDMIPEIAKQPTTQQLVWWAAGSGDFYQIHYDKDFAIGTGLDGIIVHGALKHAFLGELLWDWVQPAGRVRKVGCSYRGMDVPDQKFTLKGKVTRTYREGANNFVEVEIWGENTAGQKTTPGTGVVTLPARG